MRILITGGRGFIGTNLTRRLLQQPSSRIFVFGRNSSLQAAGVDGQVELLTGDIADASAVRAAVAQADPEVVFHLASTRFNPPLADDSEHLKVIALGTMNLLLALRGRTTTRVVYTGSGAEYGSGAGLTEDCPLAPATLLGAAKASASILMETFARIEGLPTVTLRLFAPYGPWEPATRLIPHTVLSALRGEDVKISSGQQRRDYVFIEDVVDALWLAGTQPVAPGSVFNIASGSSISIADVAETVLEVMGHPVRLIMGALPTRADEIWESSGSNAAAASGLGWHPGVSLRDGLTATIRWWQQQRGSAS